MNFFGDESFEFFIYGEYCCIVHDISRWLNFRCDELLKLY
jgi:hypothetical protein